MDVEAAIETACDEVSRRSSWTVRPASESDMPVTSSSMPRLLFGFVAIHDGDDSKPKREYLSTFYLAYSTWDGRVLYVDQVNLIDEPSGLALVSFVAMAAIAETLECARLTWQHFARPKDIFPDVHTPETLEGWLTLHWRKSAMDEFLVARDESEKLDQLTCSPDWNCISDRQKINLILEGQSAPDSVRLRQAERSDLASIGRLVQGLADFEKEPDAVNVTIDQYDTDGFSGERPLFYCLLLEAKTEEGWYSFGMAFCYIGQKVETGRFLYLEDLFIEEKYRGKGAGKCVMSTLATIAVSLGCTLLMWQALDWNSPALAFYNQIGAAVVDGLLTTRFKDQNLKEFRKCEVTHS